MRRHRSRFEFSPVAREECRRRPVRMCGLPTHGYMPTTVSANQEVHAIKKRVSVGDGVGEAELCTSSCNLVAQMDFRPTQGFGRLDYQRAPA